MDRSAVVSGPKANIHSQQDALIAALSFLHKNSHCPKDENGMAFMDCSECFEIFPFEIKTSGCRFNLAFVGH